MYPADYRYTKEHEWIKKDGSDAIVGITSYAQEALGDIVYVDLPAAGKKFQAGEVFGSIESVKAVSEIYAPVAMQVTEVNAKVSEQPEIINQDPHGAGWLIKIKLLDEAAFSQLLGADQYESLVAEKH
ncbi:MAG TPA: glycine cleavage system protein GcvH [Acidobacteriota bacterium]|nr:glycine cleavage system protein GcvH [Acidobacteriota bacterium]